MPEALTWVLFGIGAWEILRHLFRWLARHEEREFRRWCTIYDEDERQWARRLGHLHVIDGDLAPRPFDWARSQQGGAS